MAIADFNSVPRILGEPSPSEDYHKPLYREVLLMTLARDSNSDANIHPVEIEAIQRIMRRETGREVTEADVRKAARLERS